MPSITARKQKSRRRPATGASRKVIAVGLVLSLMAACAILAQRLSTPPATPPSPQPSSQVTATSLSPSSPSKEYIYAGSRLVATEQPSAANTIAAPQNLRAVALSASQVRITWAAVAGAVYELQRSHNFAAPNNGFSTVGSNINTTSYDDFLTGNTAYIYRVRAVDSTNSNNASAYSQIDLATAVAFSDDPVSAGMTVKGFHITQLREAVNCVRRAAGVGDFTLWTDSALQNIAIKKAHVDELRQKLNEALSALSLALPGYTDPNIIQSTTVMKAAHVQELRQYVTGYRTKMDS